MSLQARGQALALVLALCVAPVWAQDQKQDSPQTGTSAPIQPLDSEAGGGYAKKPAAAARGVSSPYDPEPYDPSQVTPDQNTLAGAEIFTVGSLGHTHNVFDPSISFSQLGQTTRDTSGQSNLYPISIFNGILNFNHSWSVYRLTAIYNGGETFQSGPNSSNAPYHDLNLSQELNLARWRIVVRDDFSAASGAAFTSAGMGGPGVGAQFISQLGNTLNGSNQSFLPSQTIETGTASRYMNAVLGQAQYSLSRRSTVTFSGSYGVLHFSQTGFISSNTLNGQAGYDYQINPKDSIAIVGSYGKISYIGSLDSTTDYTASLAYGRKITGRLALHVSAGPQRLQWINTTGKFQQWGGSVNSGLSYQRRWSGLSVAYQLGVTGGSGVLQGANSSTVSGSGHYDFTRFWTVSITGGYARNNNLATPGASAVQFQNWFVGGNLGHQLGPHARINFNYGLQEQVGPSACPVASCGGNGFQQTFGMTVNWHMLPAL